MAGQPSHLRAESQHRERLQSRRIFFQRRLGPAQRPVAVHRQPVFRRAAGGSLCGLQYSNPVEAQEAYDGPSNQIGTTQDPMVGNKIGGVNVFGGGLGLYGSGKVLVGGVGVSGDTSCADRNIAWRVRNNLGLDHLSGVGGVSGDPARPDNIDVTPNPYGGTGISAGGFGHPTCLNTSGSNTLPPVQP